MKSNNLLTSLYKREHSGCMNLKKPISTFSLSEKMNIGHLNDIFLGVTINCDFIISLTPESLDVENFYINSCADIYLNFNTSPLFGDRIEVFHRINLGRFQKSLIHVHFYQNALNPDLFVLAITEVDCEIILILFGNLPRLHCPKCQLKSCNKHGIIAKQSFQLPNSSKMKYSDKFHQTTTIYSHDQTLVVVIGDCESNIRFITFMFPEEFQLQSIQICKYPRSMFPFSLCMVSNGSKIVENECSCFYTKLLVNDRCKIARTRATKLDLNNQKCQLCLAKSIVRTQEQEFYYHEDISSDLIDQCHYVQQSPCAITLPRILLPDRESVVTCQPCNKKTFLSDIGASYQSLILRKLNSSNSIYGNTEYDSIHGEVLGSSNPDGSNCYQWVTSHVNATDVSLRTEELVINIDSWFDELDSEFTVHCLGMSVARLSIRRVLLIHVVDDTHEISYLVELDINTAIATIILQKPTSKEFCRIVKDSQVCCSYSILDMNNDLQVLNGHSLESIKDFSGLIELKH